MGNASGRYRSMKPSVGRAALFFGSSIALSIGLVELKLCTFDCLVKAEVFVNQGFIQYLISIKLAYGLSMMIF